MKRLDLCNISDLDRFIFNRICNYHVVSSDIYFTIKNSIYYTVPNIRDIQSAIRTKSI